MNTVKGAFAGAILIVLLGGCSHKAIESRRPAMAGAGEGEGKISVVHDSKIPFCREFYSEVTNRRTQVSLPTQGAGLPLYFQIKSSDEGITGIEFAGAPLVSGLVTAGSFRLMGCGSSGELRIDYAAETAKIYRLEISFERGIFPTPQGKKIVYLIEKDREWKLANSREEVGGSVLNLSLVPGILKTIFIKDVQIVSDLAAQ